MCISAFSYKEASQLVVSSFFFFYVNHLYKYLKRVNTRCKYLVNSLC